VNKNRKYHLARPILSKAVILKSLKAIFYYFPERNKLNRLLLLIKNSLGKQITIKKEAKICHFFLK